MAQVHEFLALNRLDQRIEVRIPVSKKEQLIFEMPVHSRFDCRRAYPDPLTAKQGRQKPQYQAAVSPQRHDTTRPCKSLGHRAKKQRTVIDFVTEGFFQKWKDIRITAARDEDLRT